MSDSEWKIIFPYFSSLIEYKGKRLQCEACSVAFCKRC